MNKEIKTIILTEILKKEELNLTFNEIMDLLEHNDKLRCAIYRDYAHEMHKYDILDTIESINEEENKNIALTDEDLEIILEDYENRLSNSDEWNTHLMNALSVFGIIE